MSTGRRFSEALRTARERQAVFSARMSVVGKAATLQQDESEPPGPPIDAELAALEKKIVPPTSSNPVVENPKVRCDYCSSIQQADMMLEVEPGYFACDACRWKWSRLQVLQST